MGETMQALIEDYRPILFRWPKDGILYAGELDGVPAWTDAHMMLVGKPPYPAGETKDFAACKPLKNAATASLKPVVPVGVISNSDGVIVAVFDNGMAIQAKYFDLIREQALDVHWFANEETEYVEARNPLDDARRVAIVMAYRVDGKELLDRLGSVTAEIAK